MTESPGQYNDQASRLDRIEAILATVSTQKAANTQAIAQWNQQ
ncbi:MULTISPECIES: hypothetical protein [unclassified Tolypothrix]|nr:MULTISPECIES: hypothetical protein [unclassified Tolypothrix]EKE96418.1 hypothetical protein FDUTEX481_09764 [Tolypothrix sp. PCC 7601]BAY96021.1 hypothetical protein NIES3275_80980 [Microchaete diplosiphon NIES-3275]